jgi:hypothetical protein
MREPYCSALFGHGAFPTIIWNNSGEINRLDKAEQMGAYINALCNANFAVMEEVSKMFDIAAVLKTPFEEAGYVTRKMILAAENRAIEIAQNALAQSMSPETVAAITEMEIEKVREIAGLGNRPFNLEDFIPPPKIADSVSSRPL